MYRVYHLTDKEKDKIVKIRWDGDTHYYDVQILNGDSLDPMVKLRKLPMSQKKNT